MTNTTKENTMQTRKIVINTCFGGFNLSDKAIGMYASLTNKLFDDVHTWEIDRADPALVQVVEELGKKADGEFSQLKVVEIPADVQWQIGEYDGIEWVEEKHRRWS